MAGVPLVCLPLGRDQPDNAQRVVEHGAGLRLMPDARPDEIADAARAVLADPRYAEAAAAIGARIRAEAETRSAERELAAFAEEPR